MQNPAQSLILEYLSPDKDAHILVLEGGDGQLAAEAAQFVPDGEILSLARDFREVKAAQARLQSIHNATATLDVFPKSDGWDITLFTIPKERRYARTLLVAAWQALKPGGLLLLAGPTKKGAKAVIKDSDRLFGNASVLGYRHHQRVASSVRGALFPDPLPKEFQQVGIDPGSTQVIEVLRPERILSLETHPGIFSWDALDEGTALLLDNLKIESNSRVWDVGCGYGVIGLSAALAGAGFVAMSDVNLIGVDYAHKNTLRNGLENRVSIFPADRLSTTQISPPFDLIVSNPAFHQGHAVNTSMANDLISSASQWLAPHGRLLIVANRFLNYDQSMQDHFKRVSRIAETNKFHVIEGRK